MKGFPGEKSFGLKPMIWISISRLGHRLRREDSMRTTTTTFCIPELAMRARLLFARPLSVVLVERGRSLSFDDTRTEPGSYPFGEELLCKFSGYMSHISTVTPKLLVIACFYLGNTFKLAMRGKCSEDNYPRQTRTISRAAGFWQIN